MGTTHSSTSSSDKDHQLEQEGVMGKNNKCICIPEQRIEEQRKRTKKKGDMTKDIENRKMRGNRDKEERAAAGDALYLDVSDQLKNLTLVEFKAESEIDNFVEDVEGEEELPKHVLYYGWFFSAPVSVVIKEIADTYLKESLKVPQFHRFLNDVCTSKGCGDPETFYRYPRKPKSKEEFQYHLTAKFLGREENLVYARPAQKFVGRQFMLHLVGAFFTAKSFGIRVHLTDGQRMLFDEERKGLIRTSPSTSNNFVASYFLRSKENSQPAPAVSEFELLDLSILEKELMTNDLKKLKNSSKHPKCKSLIHTRFDLEQEIIPLPLPQEYEPPRSRAHITIGCAPSVPPIQTGLDLVDIVDLEQQIKNKTSTSSNPVFYKDFPLEDGGTLRQFGRFGDAFVIYPPHELLVQATFNCFI